MGTITKRQKAKGKVGLSQMDKLPYVMGLVR